MNKNDNNILSSLIKSRKGLAFFISLFVHIAVLVPVARSYILNIPAQKSTVTVMNFTLDYKIGIPCTNDINKKQTEKKVNQPEYEQTKEVDNNLQKELVQKSEADNGPKEILPALSKQELIEIKKNYYYLILEQIEKNKYYPVTARRQQYEGTVTVKFTIQRDGSLQGSVLIIKRCSSEMLNYSAKKTIENASPFPAIPDSISAGRMTFPVEITYDLE